jgi:hypothetical protein
MRELLLEAFLALVEGGHFFASLVTGRPFALDIDRLAPNQPRPI